eukprot:787006-Pleurochrysis_carterae.AAC.2
MDLKFQVSCRDAHKVEAEQSKFGRARKTALWRLTRQWLMPSRTCSSLPFGAIRSSALRSRLAEAAAEAAALATASICPPRAAFREA